MMLWSIGLSAQGQDEGVQVNIPETPKQLQQEVDSLEKSLENTPDSLQWETLYELSSTYMRFPWDDSLGRKKGLEYAKQAEQLAISQADTNKWIKSIEPLLHFYGRKSAFKNKEKEREKEKLRRLLRVSQGYTIPSDYSQWEGSEEKRLENRLMVHYDSTSTLTFCGY